MGGVEEDRRLVAKDYSVATHDAELVHVMERLSGLDDDALLDPTLVLGALGLPPVLDLDAGARPRGFRLLQKIPRLPEAVSEHVVDRFHELQEIMRASEADLVQVEGVGDTRAKAIKEGLARIAESSILDRYT